MTGAIGDGLHWLIDHVITPSIPDAAREVRRLAIRLADLRDGWAALCAMPGGDGMATA